MPIAVALGREQHLRAPGMRGRKVGLQEVTHLEESTHFCKANQN